MGTELVVVWVEEPTSGIYLPASGRSDQMTRNHFDDHSA